jgi:hypothetical protein
LEAVIQQAQSLLPSLREEHALVIKEFEQEQSIVAEIENCDQEYLGELKATLAEQGYCHTDPDRIGQTADVVEQCCTGRVSLGGRRG